MCVFVSSYAYTHTLYVECVICWLWGGGVKPIHVDYFLPEWEVAMLIAEHESFLVSGGGPRDMAKRHCAGLGKVVTVE